MGRYRQVHKALKREHHTRRKFPANHDKLVWLRGTFYTDAQPIPSRCELTCAILIGFFLFLRISELEQLTWRKVGIGEDIDGGATITLVLTSPKTDQFSEGKKKVSKTTQSELCPVRMFPQWETLFVGPTHPSSLVFGTHLRTRLEATLRLAGMECDVDGIRL